MSRDGPGFTLLEFIISLSIVGIVTSIAVPSAVELISFVRGHSASNTLRIALIYARSTAVTRNEVVRLCASSDSETCSTSKHWEDGWIIYMDKSGKTTRTPDDPILQIQSTLRNLIIRKNGNSNTVKFRRDGRIGLNRSFSLCTSPNLKPFIRIVMIHSGRIRMANDDIDCS